jgi:MazG family protein
MPDTIGTRFERLVGIMARLREPGGCPWDREQTHASLRRFVLEETHEVLEAIDQGSPAELCDELGDFLFEAVFLARISEEAGDFTIGDALDAVCDKLVRRHPHVFARGADDASLTSAQVVESWAAIKARERAAAGREATPAPTTLGGVPLTLPALARAHALGSRAAEVGFDWPEAGDVVAKIEEEVAELRDEIHRGDRTRAEEEMGDLLLAIANLSRKLGIEPESALRRANAKFATRFGAVERAFAARGQSLGAATLDEMEAEWARVK